MLVMYDGRGGEGREGKSTIVEFSTVLPDTVCAVGDHGVGVLGSADALTLEEVVVGCVGDMLVG